MFQAQFSTQHSTGINLFNPCNNCVFAVVVMMKYYCLSASPALPLISYVTLEKLLNVSIPLFTICKMGLNKNYLKCCFAQ